MSQSGLAEVTLGSLADQVGMSKSGLFAHFHSKEQVQIELLRHMAQFAQAHVVQPAMSAGEGLPRLKELVNNWFGWAQRAGFPEGALEPPDCLSSMMWKTRSGNRFSPWKANGATY